MSRTLHWMCLILSAISGTTGWVDQERRVDCHPEPNPGKTACGLRGCQWDPTSTIAPKCFYGPSTGYEMQCPVEWRITPDSTSFQLVKVGTPCPYGDDISPIKVTISRKAQMGIYGTLNVRITDPKTTRYEPPVPLVDKKYPYTCAEGNCDQLEILHEFPDTLPFTTSIYNFKVVRSSTSAVLWDTSPGGLFFSEQFLQIAAFLPSRNVYGFGENLHQSLKHNLDTTKVWPMFARDEPPYAIDEDIKNLYGVHPFYLCIEPDGKAHGVLIFNSNAQEVSLGPGPKDTDTNTGILTYRTIGGILDLYFFPGPEPMQVVQQYLSLIGYPMMPAYWSLGFQLCKYGYKDLAEVQRVLERNRAAEIPQDVQFFDIDYMDRYKDFTYDKVNFRDIAQWVKMNMHDHGQKLIVILDPAIDVYSFRYEAFKAGFDQDVFVKWNNKSFVENCVNKTSPVFICPLNNAYDTTKDTDIILGMVWPDHNTAFPDWLKTETEDWWIEQIKTFHDSGAPFDGLWIDMNEPANFATNNPDAWYFGYPDHPNVSMLFCPKSDLDDPPYKTWAVYRYQSKQNPNQRLSNKTLHDCITR